MCVRFGRNQTLLAQPTTGNTILHSVPQYLHQSYHCAVRRNICFLLFWLSVEVENWTFHLTYTQCTIHAETFTSPAWLTKRGRVWKMVWFCFALVVAICIISSMTQTCKRLPALRALCALCLRMVCMSQKGTNPTWFKPGECIKSCLAFSCRIPES